MNREAFRTESDTSQIVIRSERLRHLRDLGHERVGAHAAEALLEAPDELEHEPGGVPDRVRHVADRDQLRLLPVPAPEVDLHRHAVVLEALPRRPPRVDPAPVLLSLAQRQRGLDLSPYPLYHLLPLLY